MLRRSQSATHPHPSMIPSRRVFTPDMREFPQSHVVRVGAGGVVSRQEAHAGQHRASYGGISFIKTAPLGIFLLEGTRGALFPMSETLL